MTATHTVNQPTPTGLSGALDGRGRAHRRLETAERTRRELAIALADDLVDKKGEWSRLTASYRIARTEWEAARQAFHEASGLVDDILASTREGR